MSTPSSIVSILACQKRIAGQVPYSESASTRLTSDPAHELTATDCSGMAHRMFMRYAGVDIGTYTGNEKYHGTLVTQSKSAARVGYGMLPGDLIFFDWNGGGIDHVAIYAGGGRIWNHGGPGKGPLDWSLASNVDNAVSVIVRRIVPPTTGTVTHPPVPSATSSNPMHGKPIPALIARGTGDYYGLITGPNQSHGGAYSSERPPIELIQAHLNWNPKVKAGLKVDGIFGTATAAAVSKFQHAYEPGTEFFGQVWFDDWAKMASL